MEKTGISKRLGQVAAFVPEGSRLADIGSDHAHLPLFLVQEGKISFAVAGEVARGPYDAACGNVQQSQQSSAITVRLANGLEAIAEEDKITVITIAGMGGRLIAEILEKGLSRLATVERLILQPNNCEDDVRRWLQANRYSIIAEKIVSENGKFYEVIVAEKGDVCLSEKEIRFGPIAMQEFSKEFQQKWQIELGKVTQTLQKIPTGHPAQEKLLKQIQKIKEVLDARQPNH